MSVGFMLFHFVSVLSQNQGVLSKLRESTPDFWANTMQSTTGAACNTLAIRLQYSKSSGEAEQILNSAIFHNFPVVSALGQLASGSACVGLWWGRSVHVTADSIFNLQYQAGCPVKYAPPGRTDVSVFGGSANCTMHPP